MKLIFISLTKHQYHYFNTLEKNLSIEAKQLFLPSLKLNLEGIKKSFSLDATEIENIKYKEVDAKYTNPLKAALYKKFLKAQTPFIFSTIYGVIKRYNPDLVVFWNGKKFHQSIGVKVAKLCGKKSVFFENGLLPHTTQMDLKGVNASNSVPRDASFYQNLYFDHKCVLPDTLQQRVAKIEKEAQTDTLPKQYIFIPFQVAYDTQIIQHSPWIKDMRQFFNLVSMLAEKTGLNFVIKEHPSDRVADYSDLHQQKVNGVYFSTLPTQQLIENADVIMTINSTVGIEGLLFQKRVIVLGEAFFAIEGIVKTASNSDTLLDILNNLSSWKIDHYLVENFLKYLQCTYLIPNSWREPSKTHFESIQERLEGEINGA